MTITFQESCNDLTRIGGATKRLRSGNWRLQRGFLSVSPQHLTIVSKLAGSFFRVAPKLARRCFKVVPNFNIGRLVVGLTSTFNNHHDNKDHCHHDCHCHHYHNHHRIRDCREACCRPHLNIEQGRVAREHSAATTSDPAQSALFV